MEILRKCQNGAWLKLLRRWVAQQQEMIFEIMEQRSDGRRFERRWVMEKQTFSGTEPKR